MKHHTYEKIYTVKGDHTYEEIYTVKGDKLCMENTATFALNHYTDVPTVVPKNSRAWHQRETMFNPFAH